MTLPPASPYVDDPTRQARRLIAMWINAKLEPTDEPFQPYNLEIVSFTTVMGNWKAILAPTGGSRVLYEITWDADEKTYHVRCYALARSDHLDELS